MIIKAVRRVSAKGGGTYYKILISFVFESAQYEFNSSWFQMETEETFKHLIELKNFFKDGRYEISGTMYIDDLIQSSSFSSEAKSLVYELFDYNG